MVVCKTCDGSKIVFLWGPSKRGWKTQASECPDCKPGAKKLAKPPKFVSRKTCQNGGEHYFTTDCSYGDPFCKDCGIGTP